MVQEETLCERCNDSCYGDVVNIQGKVYHQYCFSCIKCKEDLLKSGYFVIDGELYCNEHYYELYGTECDDCGKYVEGEVINVLDRFYHPECFGCRRCRKLFPTGVQIVFDGDAFLCEDCNSSSSNRKQPPKYEEVRPQNVEDNGAIGHQKSSSQYSFAKTDGPPKYDQIQISKKENEERAPLPSKPVYETMSSFSDNKHPGEDSIDSKRSSDSSLSNCAGCGNDIKSGQALLALEKQWHLWCFTCHKCGCLLAGEYMGRDGVPYCEQDYQLEFGVSCAGCGGYITGKVLQAGEKHYHPQCSRCAKCGRMFGEGEEMYLQGSEIWHPQCSEEFQREAEEADNKWLEENDFHSTSRDDETVDPVDTSSPKISFRNAEEAEVKREPPPYKHQDQNNNAPLTNGFTEGQSTSTTFMSSFDKGAHKWQPQQHSVASGSKPAGFRSFKPPSINVSVKSNEKPVEITASKEESDEEDAPPKPPPPTRTSSNAFREKYTGVYTAAPFQKSAPQPTKQRPLSYIESAARKVPTDKSPITINKTSVSIRTRSTGSSSGSVDDKTEDLQVSPTEKTFQKGHGFNKLKARKSFNDKSKTNSSPSPSDAIDPLLKQKLIDDTLFPYEVLKTDSYKTPFGVDRKRLEAYLDDREFYQVFQMARERFYALPQWKQDNMKRKAMLF